VILNRQSQVALDLRDARQFARRLKAALRLGRREFNVCFVTEGAIGKLNAAYRRESRPTDVLSFSWKMTGAGQQESRGARELSDFLGDIVISPAMARRNARHAGHPTKTEIRWLILHGVLHLLGYDHETDAGEMAVLEHSLRNRLDGKCRRARKHVSGKRREPPIPKAYRRAAGR
jgi:rRNA maturation RNase YbeY